MGLIRKEDLHESLLNSLNNHNLLINSDFRINQRNKQTYTENWKYTVDRWLLSSDADTQLDVLDNGVRMTIKSLGTWYNFSTRFDYKDFKCLLGKTLTLSFKLLTPTTKVNQIWAMCHNTENSHYYLEYGLIHEPDFYKDGPVSFISKTFTIDQIYSDGYIELGIQMIGNVGDNIEIEWAKLEVGEVATQFIPRSYDEELALCQRYYSRVRISQNLITSDDKQILVNLKIPKNMRINPTAIFDTDVYFHNSSDGNTILIKHKGDSPESMEEYANDRNISCWILNANSENPISPGLCGTINSSNMDSNRLSDSAWIILNAEIY